MLLQEKWDNIGHSPLIKSLKKEPKKPFNWLENDKQRAESKRSRVKKRKSLPIRSHLLKLEQVAGIQAEVSAQAQRQMMIAELQAKMGRSSNNLAKAKKLKNCLEKMQVIGPISQSKSKAFKSVRKQRLKANQINLLTCLP